MRILGLDIGDRRIGIALSDELGHTAQGLMVLERTGEREDIEKIRKIIEENSVTKVVVGIPLRMDGSEGIQAGKVRRFATRMESAISQPVVYYDERLTSVAARRVLISGEVRRKARRRVIDKVAASLILQGYLESQRE